MKHTKRERKALMPRLRINLIAMAVVLALAFTAFGLLRTELLRSAQEMGMSLTRSYTAEWRTDLTVYETLLDFGAEEVETRLESGYTVQEMERWIARYFHDVEGVLGEGAVDTYAVYNGGIIAANPWPGYEGYDFASTPWYQQAVAERGTVIFTDVYQESTTGRPVVTMARQCVQEDVVLAIDIYLDKLPLRTTLTDLPENSQVYLCDDQGNLIFRQAEDHGAGPEAMAGYVQDLLQSIRAGQQDSYDSYIFDLQGQRRTVYYDVMENGWTAILTIPYDTVLQRLNDFTALFAVVFAVYLVILGLMSWRDLRLNRRVQRANETVRVLGNSYYALYRVDVTGGSYEMIKGSDYVRQQIPRTGPYDLLLDTMRQVIEPDALEEYLENFSLESIRRLVCQQVRDFGGDFRSRSGGGYRWVNVRVLFDESLAPGEVVLCFREVEQEKQRQLQERRLLEDALASSRRSEKAKMAFFSNMSHDMRTPLNGILGLTDLARRSASDPEKTQDYLEKIEVSGRQLLGLINDILDMSRMEQGKVMLDYQQFDLKACIEECAGSFQAQAELENKRFDLHFDLRDAVVLGDSFRLSQILNNLLSNAFKFTNGGDTVSVAVTQVDQGPRAKYQILVKDTGIGMSESFLPQLFEPYAREMRFTSQKIVGTGLGMPIVKNLVTQMSGQIHVESQLNEGTAFTIVLPFAAVKQEEMPDAPHREAPQAEFSLEGRHILLAEDNEINMEIATEILTMNGVRVTQAWNGQEAVDKFRASAPYSFDAILMDMQMPRMDGCEAAKAIRQLSGRPDAKTVPILAVTANAFAEDIAATAAAGMDAHISKPIDFAILCTTLEKLIGKKEK